MTVLPIISLVVSRSKVQVHISGTDPDRELVLSRDGHPVARWRVWRSDVEVAVEPGHVCVWLGVHAADVSLPDGATETFESRSGEINDIWPVAEGTWLVVCEEHVCLWTPGSPPRSRIDFGDVVIDQRWNGNELTLRFLEGEVTTIRVDHGAEGLDLSIVH